jgi:PhoH-like ATPase
MESWKKESKTYYKVTGPLCRNADQRIRLAGKRRFRRHRQGNRRQDRRAGNPGRLHHPKNAVWGITARNREQNFALNLLMNPDIDFVTLLGQAGTGKTLLTLAAGLTQVLESKRFAKSS